MASLFVQRNKTGCFLCRDHAGGNNKMLKSYPDLPVYGGDDRVEGLTTMVKDGDKFNIGKKNVIRQI